MKSRLIFKWTGILFTLFVIYASMPGCGTAVVTDGVEAAPDIIVTVIEDTVQIAEDTVCTTADTICIAAVGDVMMGTENQLPSDGGESSFASCADLILNADIAFLNLEGPLTDIGAPTKNVESGNCYCFRTPPSYVRFLEEAGFNMASLANNHSRDYGQAAMEQTIAVLESSGITWSGVPGTFAVVDIDSVSVVMVAFSPYYSANMISDIPTARQIVTELAAEYDIVIVSFHGGSEGSDAIHIPFETEYYYGENRGDVVQFSRAVVDAGADLVIGHGPHVPRAAEVYNGRLIAYSLGNFCTGRGINSSGLNGYAPLLLVELDKTGCLLGGEVVSFLQAYDQAPFSDQENRAMELMYQLGIEDFPESNAIAPDGTIIVPNVDE